MLVGWLGSALIVGAYALVSSGKVHGKHPAYQGMNLLGSLLLGVDVWLAGSMPAVALQVVWATIALLGLVSFFMHSRTSPQK